MTFIDWREEQAPGLFFKSRLRHWAARKITGLPGVAGALAPAALSRIGPELLRAATGIPAELYIAHNLGALPAACAAAAKHGSRVAFDAEDFHSGQLSAPSDAHAAAVARSAERRYLPRCAYVTAAAPGIAEAYRDLCGIPLPT